MPEWTCASCSVRTTIAPGHPVPDLPAGWTRQGGNLRCLACGRAAAVEAALAAADSKAKPGRVKGEALARFELLRNPERTDAMIAKAAGTYAAVVRGVRSEIAAQLPTTGRPSRNPGAGRRVEAELRRDPHRSNVEIARAADTGDQTVSRLRRRLEAAGEIERRR